jgi:hypothetical protein
MLLNLKIKKKYVYKKNEKIGFKISSSFIIFIV